MFFKVEICFQGETPYSLLHSQKNATWIGKKVHDKIHEMSGSKRRNPCYRITRDKVSRDTQQVHCRLTIKGEPDKRKVPTWTLCLAG